MKRRTFLVSSAALVGTCAGCTNIDSSNNNGGKTSPTEPPTESPTESPTDSPSEISTETPTETPSESPTETTGSPTTTPEMSGAVTETTFELIESTCGTGPDEASTEQGSSQITVNGTISGSNGCYTAELKRAAYDTDTSELTVAIQSFPNRRENTACRQCIVDIEYQATVSYDASDPETVTIIQNDEQVN